MTILVCGFSSFPGAPRNPTEAMAKTLETDPRHGQAFHAAVLPVEWDASWPRLRGLIETVAPTAVLLFGLHQRAERLRIERVARNRRKLGQADAVGAFPSGPAVLDGPEALACNMPWTAVAEALRGAGVSFEWSSDAGGYLCNDTLYRLAFHAEVLGVRHFGFFHVPLSDEGAAEAEEIAAMPEIFCSMPAAHIVAAALAIAERLEVGPSS
ncbi:hypothetical protein VQ042_06855 [Aurantimonas sp. A2-1-M11]|uniref:pyroglutamyl-peptidase I family protein n=1 Tax=Aurantimonas sp. A2-1-M11 TaxID=3113712 RepID=UPI002F9292E3